MKQEHSPSNYIPLWQKRGIGVYWETYWKDAVNPKTGEKVQAERRRLKTDTELPMKDDYSRFVEAFLTDEECMSDGMTPVSDHTMPFGR